MSHVCGAFCAWPTNTLLVDSVENRSSFVGSQLSEVPCLSHSPGTPPLLALPHCSFFDRVSILVGKSGGKSGGKSLSTLREKKKRKGHLSQRGEEKFLRM